VSTTLLLTLVGLIAVASIVAAIATFARMSRAFLRSPSRRPKDSPQTAGLDGGAFAIPTADGAVRGWRLRDPSVARADLPIVILTHGWAAAASDMYSWAAPLVRAGYEVIVYDVLGHGVSDERELTSIAHFVIDLRAVCAWARAHSPAGLVLFGHSLGGGAAIVAAAERDDLRALIVAAAPSDPADVTAEWLDQKGRPGGLIVAGMRPFWRRLIPEPYETVVPRTRIREVRMPILILHGDADKQVNIRHARTLAAAQPRAQLEVFAGGDHFSLPRDPRYATVITEFLDRALAGHHGAKARAGKD